MKKQKIEFEKDDELAKETQDKVIELLQSENAENIVISMEEETEDIDEEKTATEETEETEEAEDDEE